MPSVVVGFQNHCELFPGMLLDIFALIMCLSVVFLTIIRFVHAQMYRRLPTNKSTGSHHIETDLLLKLWSPLQSL